MKRYRLKSIQRETDLLYVTLEPKRPRDRFDFYPGQYATIGFKTESGRRSPMRCFSIVSAQGDADLQFTMRLGGRFTQTLSRLQAGTDMYVQGPFGEFVIDPRYDRRVVMLAGGIGITPFMSMIRTACRTDSQLPISLLHTYRSGHHIPFHEELKMLQAQNPRLRVATFVSDSATLPEAPRLFSGRINEGHIRQVVGGEYAGSTYFVCGPKGFMDSVTTMLKAQGINEDRIITESFTQSSKVFAANGHSIPKLTYAFATALMLAGVAGIAFLDLSRYVPRYVQAVNSAQPAAPTTAAASPSTPSTTDTAGQTSQTATDGSGSNTGSPPSASSSSSISSTPSTTSSQSAQQTYQPPVTSVS